MHKLNYVEFASTDLSASKDFFNRIFSWEFTDYGSEYTAFSQDSAGIDGGFYQHQQVQKAEQGAPLLVLYSAELEATQTKVEAGGGKITQAIFSFPGGRRFHFVEPGGNELAVWSDKE